MSRQGKIECSLQFKVLIVAHVLPVLPPRAPPPQNLEKAKETKLSTQLHKIEGLMKEKGTYSEAAFRAKPEEPFEAPTPMRAKRMRI
jgi:hypothetical protein